jgi:hypothetical protein
MRVVECRHMSMSRRLILIRGWQSVGMCQESEEVYRDMSVIESRHVCMSRSLILT